MVWDKLSAGLCPAAVSRWYAVRRLAFGGAGTRIIFLGGFSVHRAGRRVCRRTGSKAMNGLFEKLHQASVSLAGTAEPEDAERLLLEELRQMCTADLAVLLQPLSPKSWQSVLWLPESDSPPRQVELSWDSESGSSGLRSAVEQVVSQRKSLSCLEPVLSGEFDFSHLRQVEVEQEKRIQACLLLPLLGRDGKVGQIIELLRFAQAGAVEGFSREEHIAAEILVQQAGLGLQRVACQRELRDLFESLIQLIGSAIDEKSPYAGDHCRRVPVLTMMLARAVSASERPEFAAIRFSEAELYELEVAAWLHDIGKLITPIHVSDKATKLERTFDRFDLVRTRFEILRRDLEIEQLRAGGKGGEVEIPTPTGDAGQMLDDLRFLADCNQGRNPLSSEETARVRTIAERYHWIDRQGEEMSILTDDEAANLMVVRGTLTDEEREMLNQHVVSTINMLDMLPFPEELARVPEIAGAHHEFHEGRGFPSGTKGRQLPMQARILAFADRFESISAGSRPYKHRNSLNQSLNIMREMVDAGEADPALFRFFIEDHLYESYAIEFLSRDQIDPVDRDALLEGLS